MPSKSTDIELAHTGTTLGDAPSGYSSVPKNDSNSEKSEGWFSKLDPGIRGLRFCLLVMLLEWAATIALRYLNINWGHVECELPDLNAEAQSLCIRQNAVFRVSAIVAAFFTLHGFGSAMAVQHMFDRYWLVKLPVVVGAAFCSLYFQKANIFNDALFIWWARIGAFLFIIFQQLIMLDFAYMWNDRWYTWGSSQNNAYSQSIIEQSSLFTVYKSVWLLGLLLVSVTLFGIFIVSMVLLYYYYGGAGCSVSNTIITISLFGMVAAGLIQMLGSKGAMITTGILMVYVAYVTYSAVSMNPDPQCNPLSDPKANGYGTGPSIPGIIFGFVSIVYTSTVSSKTMTGLLSSGGVTQSTLTGVITGQTSGSDAGFDMKKSLRSSVFFFHIIYGLLTLYLSMTATNWGIRAKDYQVANQDTSRVAMWMQTAAAWIAIALYIVALVTPAFKYFPKSVWSFYPDITRD